MSSFIARVELHHAAEQDYVTLHAAMAKRGFSRKIASDQGQLYWLPTGTYDVASTNSTLSNALDAAKAAANETGRASSVVVGERSAAMWRDLIPA